MTIKLSVGEQLTYFSRNYISRISLLVLLLAQHVSSYIFYIEKKNHNFEILEPIYLKIC